MKHGRNAPFKKVANGVPGLEVRTALLFSEAVGKGRIDLPTFVAASPRDPSQLMPSRRGNRAGRTMLLRGGATYIQSVLAGFVLLLYKLLNTGSSVASRSRTISLGARSCASRKTSTMSRLMAIGLWLIL